MEFFFPSGFSIIIFMGMIIHMALYIALGFLKI